jgi:hypothetical protein
LTALRRAAPGLALRRAAPGLALLLLAGCELTSVEIADPDDVVVVEVYLRAGEFRQRAFVHRTLPGESGTLEVPGALIRVIHENGGTMTFTAVPFPGVCTPGPVPDAIRGSCYESNPPPDFVQPGATYVLEVDLPDGGRIRGETTVPGPMEILRPAADSCAIDSSAYEFVWTRSEGAWAYQAEARFENLAPGLQARGVEDPPDTLRLLGLSVSGSDTTLTFPSEFGVFDRFDLDRDLLLALQDGLPEGARATVTVAAGDRNFVNWVRGGNFNPSGLVRIPSVTGDGVGVFASLVAARRWLTSTDSTGGTICQ